MAEENISQKFSLKNIDEIKKYFIEEIKQYELIRKICKKVCEILNYIDNLLILASTVTRCVFML